MQRANTKVDNGRVKLNTTKGNHTNSKDRPKSMTFNEDVEMARVLPGGKTTGKKLADRNTKADKY